MGFGADLYYPGVLVCPCHLDRRCPDGQAATHVMTEEDLAECQRRRVERFGPPSAMPKLGGGTRVERYEFLLELQTRDRVWASLQGNSGCVGDGLLHVTDSKRIGRIAKQLLHRVRVELARGSGLYMRSGATLDSTTFVHPLNVIACRAIDSKCKPIVSVTFVEASAEKT